MVLVVGQNSVWQHTYFTPKVALGGVNRVKEALFSAAGKGTNAARALAQLGEKHHLLAYAGGGNGEKYRIACANDGISATCTDIPQETRTCVTLIGDDGVVTEIVESAPHSDPASRETFGKSFQSLIAHSRFLIIAGTAIAGEPESRYLDFIKQAHKHGVPVLLDSYRAHGIAALKGSPEVLKINADELGELTAIDTHNASARQKACEYAMNQHGLKWIIVTLGSEGAEGFDGKRYVHCPSEKVTVVNTIGSGDVFSAGVAVEYLKGAQQDIEACLNSGIALASANCASWKPGDISGRNSHRL